MPDFEDAVDDFFGGSERDRRIRREKQSLAAQQQILRSQNLANDQLDRILRESQDHSEIARAQLEAQQREIAENRNFRYQQWLDTTTGKKYTAWEKGFAVPFLTVIREYRASFRLAFVADARTVRQLVSEAESRVSSVEKPPAVRLRTPAKAVTVLVTAAVVVQLFGVGFFTGILGLILGVTAAVLIWKALDRAAERAAGERTRKAFPDGTPPGIGDCDLYRSYTYYFAPMTADGARRAGYSREDFATDLGLGRVDTSHLADRHFAADEEAVESVVTTFMAEVPVRLPMDLPTVGLPQPLNDGLPPERSATRRVTDRYRQSYLGTLPPR